MPLVTYLDDAEVRHFRHVDDDPECDELLQELRRKTKEDWLVEVRRIPMRRSLLGTILRRSFRTFKQYTLYADCHGEWQAMNMITPSGGSVFNLWEHSREAVMNFMLGQISAIDAQRKAT